MKKTAFIIQARTGSTRMPNKILQPFFIGKSILELLLEKLSGNFSLPIILATTTSPFDDPVEEIAIKNNIICFRGSESNVLDRFIKAAEMNRIENIIRICSDNPFLSVEYLQNLLDEWNETIDYLSFRMNDGTPSIKTHYGLFAEMVSLNCLQKVQKATDEIIYLEHVTNYIYEHPDQFHLTFIPIDSILQANRDIRLTLDTPNDFTIQKQIFSELYQKNPNFRTPEILNFLEEHPDITEKMRKEIEANLK